MKSFTELLDKCPEEKTDFFELNLLLKESEDLDEDQREKMELEKLALAFSTNLNSNEYYGPFTSGKNSDGSVFEFPNKSMVTKEALDYWRERAAVTTNPLMKLRYLGLQLAFRPLVKEKSTGQERSDYITSIIEAIDKDIFKYPISGFEHLNRAMQIASTTKNTAVIEAVKAAYFGYDKKYSNDDSPGLYSNIVYALKNNPNAFSEAEKEQIEKNLADRHERLAKGDNYSLFRECVQLMVDYYGVKNKEKALSLLRGLENKTISMKDKLGAMQTQVYLHQINSYYFTLSSKEDQERLAVEIAKIGPEIVSSLNPVEIPFSKELMESIKKANEYLTSGTPNERLVKFIGTYWHHKSKDQAEAEKQKKNSLMGLFATIVYDQTGRMTTVSSSSEDNDKGAVEHFRTFAPMMAYVHHPALLQDIKDDIIGKKTVLEIIRNCPSFYPDSMTLIEKALDAYYANDYLQFMHLIIPQIERACRNFVGMRGESTYSNRDIRGGYSFLTFEGVLRSKSITDIENGDLAYHLMAVFTDNHGLNLRNDVMHGMAPMAYFSYQYADIVFHSLILAATLMH